MIRVTALRRRRFDCFLLPDEDRYPKAVSRFACHRTPKVLLGLEFLVSLTHKFVAHFLCFRGSCFNSQWQHSEAAVKRSRCAGLKSQMRKRPITLFLLLLTLCTSVHSQQPAPSPTTGTKNEQSPAPVKTPEEVGEGEVIRIDANLITVPVTVFNRQGQYVVDLTRNEFHIYEDDVEQEIVHFSNVDNPFSVVLLIDTSGSTAPFMNQIKEAAKFFVEQLRPFDVIRPVFFHGEIKSLIDAGTSDVTVLRNAIDRMEAGPLERGTRLYDAIDFTLNVLKPKSGRKAVILLTDGENTWGKATMKDTLREAEESDVIIYPLQYGDLPPQKYLQQLAEKTGGRYFSAGEMDLIRLSLAGVAEELRRQYFIGYYAGERMQNGQQRRIKVKVDRKNVAVRARQFYTDIP
jgi:VWFA-related protein